MGGGSFLFDRIFLKGLSYPPPKPSQDHPKLLNGSSSSKILRIDKHTSQLLDQIKQKFMKIIYPVDLNFLITYLYKSITAYL